MKPTVFFVEKEPCRELHAHIPIHLPRMQYRYEWEGCELVYLPLHELANLHICLSTSYWCKPIFKILQAKHF